MKTPRDNFAGRVPTDALAEAQIAARLDRLPATGYIWRLVALISFGAFFEIYDIALSGPLTLGLIKAGVFSGGRGGPFGMTGQAIFIALTFAGLYVGTLGFSAVADRLGRRPIFAWSLLWYALATVVMGLQTSQTGIIVWRFIASIGVGVELVAIDCYLAELLPKAVRGRGFAMSTAIQFLAAPLVGVLSIAVMPKVVLGIAGWRFLAFVPAIGAILVWWVRRALPESPRWLAAHGRGSEAESVMAAIEMRVAARLPGPLPAPEAEASPETSAERADLWELFRAPYARRTWTMVVFHLFQTIGYYGFTNWLPTLLVSRGIGLTKSLSYTLATVVILPIAPLIFGRFADRIERKWMIVGGALTAALFGLIMSGITARSSFALYTLIGLLVTAGNSAMSLAYHTYQSELFPTRIRARAVGFVYSFSRLSAIFSTFLIAALLADAGSTSVFVLIAGSMVVVAVMVGLFGPRTRGLALEQISPPKRACILPETPKWPA